MLEGRADIQKDLDQLEELPDILKINKDKFQVLHSVWTKPPQRYRAGSD